MNISIGIEARNGKITTKKSELITKLVALKWNLKVRGNVLIVNLLLLSKAIKREVQRLTLSVVYENNQHLYRHTMVYGRPQRKSDCCLVAWEKLGLIKWHPKVLKGNVLRWTSVQNKACLMNMKLFIDMELLTSSI